MASSEKKGRYWWFVTYETNIDKLRQELEKTMGDYAISPVHKPDDEQKKKHVHVIYMHPNTVSMKVAKEVIPEHLPANGYLEMVRNPTNAERYLLHLDSPEKQQFSGAGEITIVNNFPLDLSKPLSKEEIRQLHKKVFAFIREYGIMEYSELLDSLENFDVDMHFYAFNHTIAFGKYLDSRRFVKGDEDPGISRMGE